MIPTLSIQPFLFVVCGAVYATLSSLIAIQARQATNWVLALCCMVTAAWAGTQAAWPESSLSLVPAAFDLLRSLAWYAFVLHLYHRSGIGSRTQLRVFLSFGLGAAVLAVVAVVQQAIGGPQGTSIWSLPIAVHLGLAVCELLLIENLYLNLPEHMRWHVAVPCMLLGGLACFDILVCADQVLFRQPSPALAAARAAVTVLVAPLLVLASFRGQRWEAQLRLSRTAVFHSATLILSGGVLLGLAAAGEVFRHFGADWGWIAEISLMFTGLIGLGLTLTSKSARSRIQRLVVQHFFADRYDYRQQWLDCIDTLSGPGGGMDGRTALHTRAIRALADVVDSPNGALFLREGTLGSFSWAGSWNMPAAPALPATHAAVGGARGGHWIVDLGRLPPGDMAPLDRLGRVWLAIPLLHREELTGLVVVGPPRVAFRADQEVFDLLRTVGREVATYVAEQRATQVMVQTRHLHDYSKRFAFVAHDIKNLSSQLALLLRNAEHHISNPEFQKDMLETVGASVQKITGLLKRLETPEADRAPAALTPLPRLETLVTTYRRVRQARIELEHDGSTATVAMGADAFDTAVTHLLNNAVEASSGMPGRAKIEVKLRHEVHQVVIDIADEGCGMSPEFVRDQLFRPFTSHKQGGSGIGAFQARELLRESGGDLVVISHPGTGTTMRLLLARADTPAVTPPHGELAAAAP